MLGGAGTEAGSGGGEAPQHRVLIFAQLRAFLDLVQNEVTSYTALRNDLISICTTICATAVACTLYSSTITRAVNDATLNAHAITAFDHEVPAIKAFTADQPSGTSMVLNGKCLVGDGVVG